MLEGFSKSYGILEQTSVDAKKDEYVEELVRLGFTIVPSGFSDEFLAHLKSKLDEVAILQAEQYGEPESVRCPMQYDAMFLKTATNSFLLDVIGQLIQGQFVLNQQNGVINPPKGKQYGQAAFHRDFPYQHFTSSRPLGINALLCLDEFTVDNGATLAVPCSHKFESFPSKPYLNKHTKKILANAGDYIVLDCMTYHAGGANQTTKPRRAINHVYTIPYFRQQIDIPNLIRYSDVLSPEDKQLLGFNNPYHLDLESFYSQQNEKNKK